MNRRHFLWRSAGAVPALAYLSCGGESGPIVVEVEPFPDDSLAPYTHPPLELSDEFDGLALGSQWRVVGLNTPIPAMWSVSWGERPKGPDVKVAFSDGHLRLAGKNNESLGLMLYGVYGGRRRLEEPWAMEALLELPDLDYSQTPARGGITIRASNEDGWAAYVELGRVAGPGVNKSFLFHQGSYQEGWTGKDAIETARRVCLRIESSDPKRRTVRCGMKAAEGDDWTWSRALKFRRPILFLDNIHLMNFDARHEGLTAKLKSPPPLYSRLVDEERLGKTLKPAGKEVTVSFDYARFEGKVVSRKEGVDYVRTEIPEVETVFPEGEHYEAVVPDTFDIEERSRLAVHGLTCLTDPNADFEIHWWGDFTRRPPVLHHDWNDTVQPKFMEALPLLRVVSGSKENWHVEQRWSEIALHMQGPDGLLYYPVIGRPWNFDTEWEGVANRQEHVAPHGMEGRMLGAMTVFYYRDRSPVWREASACFKASSA